MLLKDLSQLIYPYDKGNYSRDTTSLLNCAQVSMNDATIPQIVTQNRWQIMLRWWNYCLQDHKLWIHVRENQIIVPPVLIKVCKLCVGRARYRIIAPEIISGRISVAQEHICALGLDL